MHSELNKSQAKVWLIGAKDTMPLVGGIISVAISFGVIASKSGFNFWEAIAISFLMHAGASQFIFVTMLASGAPIYLIIFSTLLINCRHIVYGPNLAPYMSKSPWWFALMHGLTDQVFALAHNRLPKLVPKQRIAWFYGAVLTSWGSWVLGTAIGAVMGSNIMTQFPILAEALPFTLPALFIVLLAPQCNSLIWCITLIGAVCTSLLLNLVGYGNVAILLGAICGTALYYLINNVKLDKGRCNG